MVRRTTKKRLDALKQQCATFKRRLAVTQIMAIKYGEFSNDRTSGKLVPTQINVVPPITNKQTVPKMNFFSLPCPDLSPDDFSCRIIVLDHAGAWIALPQRGIASLLNASIGS